MLIKKIKYTDFNGQAREEDFYFNLKEDEVAEMELTTDGGLKAYIERIVQKKDNAALIRFFKDFIRRSYGEKSLDGKQFVKRPELFESFYNTNAYSVLFIELITNPDACSAFVNAVIPQVSISDNKSVEASNFHVVG